LATRDQLLEAAAIEIQRVGFDDATIEAITKAAGVTPGALYFHFRSKEAIAQTLIERQHQTIREAAHEIQQQVNAPSLVVMMMMCDELARGLIDEPLVRAGIRLTIDRSTFGSRAGDPYRDWLVTFTDLAGRAESAGETTGALPPDVLAHFIVPAFAGVQLLSDTLTRRTDLLLRVHEMWQVLILAVVPGARQESMFSAARRVFAQPS
jgi:AcrR family transcriptional regulator